MKAINMEKIYAKTKTTTKKIKVNEAIVGLQSAMNDIHKFTHIKIDNATYNYIVTYFGLNLLRRTHSEKDYDELFNSFLDEEEIEKTKESEA